MNMALRVLIGVLLMLSAWAYLEHLRKQELGAAELEYKTCLYGNPTFDCFRPCGEYRLSYRETCLIKYIDHRERVRRWYFSLP